jgi:GPI mannosyltransferase 3
MVQPNAMESVSAAGERPLHASWSLPCYLLIGWLLRLPGALFASGYSFLDQQYQYVDPAWHLATGAAWYPTWEWIDGIRSWVYPGLLAGLFAGVRPLTDDPMVQMALVRAAHALIGSLPLAGFWLLVVRWRPVARPRPALLLFALSGIGVHACVQPAGPNFAAALSVAAVLFAIGPGRWPLLGGAMLGLAFCARCQEAMLGPIVVACLMWQRQWTAATWFALGTLPGIALQGLVDLWTWGHFLHSPFEYVRQNLVYGAAARWRTEPWWWYAALVLPAMTMVPPLLPAAWRMFSNGVRHAVVPAIAALVYVLLHSAIDRKALRFLWPALWLLVGIGAIGLVQTAANGSLSTWQRRLFIAGQVALFAWASLWPGNLGPVRAAIALAREPAFTDELIVVDGDATAIGGFYHLRRSQLQVHAAPRPKLSELLAALPPRSERWLMVSREPLTAEVVPCGRLLPAGEFTGFCDLRRSERRYLYRLVRE